MCLYLCLCGVGGLWQRTLTRLLFLGPPASELRWDLLFPPGAEWSTDAEHESPGFLGSHELQILCQWFSKCGPQVSIS